MHALRNIFTIYVSFCYWKDIADPVNSRTVCMPDMVITLAYVSIWQAAIYFNSLKLLLGPMGNIACWNSPINVMVVLIKEPPARGKGFFFQTVNLSRLTVGVFNRTVNLLRYTVSVFNRTTNLASPVVSE